MINKLHDVVVEYFDFLEHKHWVYAGDFFTIIIFTIGSIIKWSFILLVTYWAIVNFAPEMTKDLKVTLCSSTQ